MSESPDTIGAFRLAVEYRDVLVTQLVELDRRTHPTEPRTDDDGIMLLRTHGAILRPFSTTGGAATVAHREDRSCPAPQDPDDGFHLLGADTAHERRRDVF